MRAKRLFPFGDKELERLKEEIKDKTLDETVTTTGAKLHALLDRLEAAETVVGSISFDDLYDHQKAYVDKWRWSRGEGF